MSAELTRRLQILLDEPRYERLERLARSRGTSVAAVVREAIDATFPEGAEDRAEAAHQFLAADPIDFGDWDTVKRDLESFYEPPVS